eukprot:jgi/Chrzof1/6709/Cz19g06130.t1
MLVADKQQPPDHDSHVNTHFDLLSNSYGHGTLASSSSSSIHYPVPCYCLTSTCMPRCSGYNVLKQQQSGELSNVRFRHPENFKRLSWRQLSELITTVRMDAATHPQQQHEKPACNVLPCWYLPLDCGLLCKSLRLYC